METMKKQITDTAKGFRAANVINKKLQQSLEESEKKDDGKHTMNIIQIGIPNAEFIKVQDAIKDQTRRLE
jgi:hypothetical protein